MLRAIILDFNGVIIDDEPLHFLAFREAFAGRGIRLSRRLYYQKYLAFDDRTAVTEILTSHGLKATRVEVLRLRRLKKQAYDRLLKTRLRLFPGAVELIRSCAERYPLAIASGALRSEIQTILDKFQLRKFFCTVVSADDVAEGKPHPETFLRALKLLNKRRPPGTRRIRADECVVIEDSLHGVEAAHEAGMKCMAVATSYPWSQLVHADGRSRSTRSLRRSMLEKLFER